MKLSVIIPTFNEQKTIVQIITNVCSQKKVFEVVVVDDGSTDKTLALLKKIKNKKLRIFSHNKNLGKGAAIKTGLAKVNGDFIIIQDADLEYDPTEYSKLIHVSSYSTVVYGSRIKGNNPHAYTRTYLGNTLITAFANLLFGINLSDAYTCYKLIPTKIAKDLNLSSNGFEIEAEITGKLAKKGIKIIEVPITFRPRGYEEGKKIKARDAIVGSLTFLQIRFPFLFSKKFLLPLAILLIGLFFRTYELTERFDFAHDGDLYSWIVKDILVNHHFRLIGQETTAKGIFIGPLFYYLLSPFFLLTKMDPVGAVIPITIISMLTIFSYFWVFKKLFGENIGLIASFLYATLLNIVQLDRRVVPSTPSNLWTIWYFFVVINLVRGNFSVLPILAILIALIWHIHIALAPALLTAPLAIFFSKKLPNLKQLIIFLSLLGILSLPFIGFEVKHQLLQTKSFFHNFSINQGGGIGLEKYKLLSLKANFNTISLIFTPWSPIFLKDTPLIAVILASGFLAIRKKIISKKELLTLFTWIAGVFIFYTFSSTIISEYYLSNIEIIYLAIFSFLLYILLNLSKYGKALVFTLLFLILIKNVHFLVTQTYYHKGYLEKKAVAQYIAEEAKNNTFPCIAVSYITAPGEDRGFRYFFYLNNLHVNEPKSGSPVYTIILPDELARGQNEKYFGHIKIIPPEKFGTKEEIAKSCSGANSNLTDPLLGYTE